MSHILLVDLVGRRGSIIWMQYSVPTKEIDLFNFVKENFISDLQMSEVKYSRFDCYSLLYHMDIELKCRRTHYDDLLIERSKHDALLERSIKFSTRPVYINSTPLGVWAFYISHIRIKWEEKDLPRNTDFGDQGKIKKEIGYLNIEDGIKLM
jgi:hypothetical protein